jgi:hypothetical protein
LIVDFINKDVYLKSNTKKKFSFKKTEKYMKVKEAETSKQTQKRNLKPKFREKK